MGGKGKKIKLRTLKPILEIQSLVTCFKENQIRSFPFRNQIRLCFQRISGSGFKFCCSPKHYV